MQTDKTLKQPFIDKAATLNTLLKNEPTMNKAEFDQIKDGMTYKQVTKIVGGPGQFQVKTGTQGIRFIPFNSTAKEVWKPMLS